MNKDKELRKSLNEKLEETIKAVPEEFKDAHHLSPHWYVSELCRYIKREINDTADYEKYRILLDMSIIKIKEVLNYRGLSFFDEDLDGPARNRTSSFST